MRYHMDIPLCSCLGLSQRKRRDQWMLLIYTAFLIWMKNRPEADGALTVRRFLNCAYCKTACDATIRDTCCNTAIMQVDYSTIVPWNSSPAWRWMQMTNVHSPYQVTVNPGLQWWNILSKLEAAPCSSRTSLHGSSMPGFIFRHHESLVEPSKIKVLLNFGTLSESHTVLPRHSLSNLFHSILF